MVTITPEQVRAIVDRYNKEYPDRKAFASLGHPTAPGAPSYGWVTSTTATDRLDSKGQPVTVAEAEWSDFQPEFFDGVKRGLWRERSAGIRDGRLDHVAWLGAELPAVKGLAPVTFSEEGAEITIYTQNAEFALPTDDSQPEDTSMPLTPEDIAGVAKGVADALKPTLDAIAEKLDGKKPAGEDPPADAANLSEKIETTDTTKAAADVAALQAQVVALNAKVQEQQFSEFLGSESMKLRVTPGERPIYLAMMKRAADLPGEFEFSERVASGESVAKKGSALDQIKAELLALPEKVNLSEIATRDAAGKLIESTHIANGSAIAKSSQRK